VTYLQAFISPNTAFTNCPAASFVRLLASVTRPNRRVGLANRATPSREYNSQGLHINLLNSLPGD
jgi:hypothetical protein